MICKRFTSASYQQEQARTVFRDIGRGIIKIPKSGKKKKPYPHIIDKETVFAKRDLKQDLRKTQICLYIHTNAVKIHPITIEREPHIYADILNY